ncbi:MAG: NTP transferase domain-containing protein [Ilumatobacteraceae bacterium]
MSDTDHGTVSAIVLAAGHGTRMRSNRPKPLHRMCGRPIVLHAIWALCDVLPERTVVVVGNSAERVTKRVQESSPEWANVVFAEQAEQRGTGDAALTGLTGLPGDDLDDESTVVVLPGDAPLLLPSTIVELVTTHVRSRNAATVLTAVVADPTGYGRVIRGPDASVRAIVEERDADDEERQVTEINTSVYAFRRDLFGPALRRISPHNAQSEYYLTDVIAVLSGIGHRVGGVEADAAETPRRERSVAAGARRARTAGEDQPPLAARGRDDARPAPDVRRRRRATRARRHALPGHDPRGHDDDRRPLHHRTPDAPHRLRRRRELHGREHRRSRGRGRVGVHGRAVRGSRTGHACGRRRGDRRVLH